MTGFALALRTVPALAGPINTDVALTPPTGGSLLRLQFSYTEFRPRDAVRAAHLSTISGTYVYGATKDVALFLRAPYAHRDTHVVNPRLGRVEVTDSGVPDLTVMAKYRFWQRDTRPGETYRWAALGGLDLRSGDSAFSSDSYDPIVGTVFTWQRDRGVFGADLVYQLNTGGGASRHDTLRYDVAYSFRLFPTVYEMKTAWELDAVAELNGRYDTDGSHEVFLAPGLQLIGERWTVETSIQLPVIQELGTDRAETDYRVVFGLRLRW
ncbi:MAG: transporter [Phycisphaerae bacterium]